MLNKLRVSASANFKLQLSSSLEFLLGGSSSYEYGLDLAVSGYIDDSYADKLFNIIKTAREVGYHLEKTLEKAYENFKLFS